jgi:type IV pilus assembly protein PilM
MFEQTIVGLDIGSWSVKFAEMEASLRGAHFTRFEELILPGGVSPEELEATVQLFAQQRSINTDCLVTALDTRLVTQRHLRFPFTGAKRIAAAIEYEIDEELPIDVEDVLIAHDMVRVRPDQTDVLVLIASRDEMDRYLESMERMEFDPQRVDAQGATLANLSHFFELNEVPRVVLDVGHEKTNVCLLVDGHPIALRRVPIAGHALTAALAQDRGWDWAEAQEHKHSNGIFEHGSTKPLTHGIRDALDRLARETQRSIQSVISDPADPLAPAEILLVGGSARLPGLDAYLAERTGLMCKSLGAAPGSKQSAVMSEISLASYAQAMSLCLGSARTERVTDTDFRQDQFAHRPDLAGMRSQLQMTLALFGLLLVLWVGAGAVRALVAERDVRQRDRAISSIHEQLFPGEPLPSDALDAIERRARETRELAGHLGVTETGSSALDMLRQISEQAPPGLDVQLDDLRITARSITARGHGRDIASIERFRSELAKVPEFRDVQVANVANDPRRGGRKTFTVNVRLGDQG